jgi:SAM-dependent methyltransferase
MESKLKTIVREKYAAIALQDKETNASSCCGATNSSSEVYQIMAEEYDDLQGYVADADLGLGCGLPTQFARINPGDTVIDLGSGAGNDCFIARHETGAEGKVIGIDFTPEMIKKARQNAEKLGLNNVEFREGDIDDMPVNDDSSDVVVSNCVLNLVPDKVRVIQEIFRVLKPGGHFSISDIVLVGNLPDSLREDAEMYAGCVSGAIQKDDYLGYIEQTGFQQITIQKEKRILIPDDILNRYLNPSELASFRKGDIGIFSITVYAEKPPSPDFQTRPTKQADQPACTPASNCC